MQKIGHSTAGANGNGEFTSGSPQAGVDATQITAPWLNAVQRELVNLVEGLGGVVDPDNDEQLLEGVRKLASDVSTWENIKNRPNSLLALSRITRLSADTSLTAADAGLVLVDAGIAARTIMLPPASPALGVCDLIIRRVDSSGNRLTVRASGADKIKFHTHLSSSGYPFLVLLGSGDWWHLRSDGAGSWWPVGRFDPTPLGRTTFETTTQFQPGGYSPLDGAVLNRADWPWLWDHAQQSGMMTTEAARVGKEGGWTSGDGASTFRGPEGRGVFLRMLDETKGVDANRAAGSQQLDAIQNIIGGITATNGVQLAGNATGAFDVQVNGGVSLPGGAAATGAINLSFNASRVVRTSAETRPINIAYPGRIKLI